MRRRRIETNPRLLRPASLSAILVLRVAAVPRARRAEPCSRVGEATCEATLSRGQISDEIVERQQFIEEMMAVGRRQQAEVVQGQIVERMGELRRLEQLMRE